jgi:uncharacterized damage-inducible protein DinB
LTDVNRTIDPDPRSGEREVLLGFLRRERGKVLQTARDLTDEQARWTPPGKLICLLGIINHLTHVEWRWIDGRYLCQEVSRSEEEFVPAPDRTLADVVSAYVARAARTDATVRGAPGLDAPCLGGQVPMPGLDLRWVLLHLIEETAHHCGHADSTREMLDGSRHW